MTVFFIAADLVDWKNCIYILKKENKSTKNKNCLLLFINNKHVIEVHMCMTIEKIVSYDIIWTQHFRRHLYWFVLRRDKINIFNKCIKIHKVKFSKCIFQIHVKREIFETWSYTNVNLLQELFFLYMSS